MQITESMKRAGWKRVGSSWVAPPASERVVAESREQRLESIAAGYRALGLSEAESRFAADLEARSINEGARFFKEQGTATTPDPLDALGTTSKEFQATQKVLEGNGYSCASVTSDKSAALFSKADCRGVFVKLDGSWLFAEPKDDSVRGTQDPFAMKGNNTVTSGTNSFGLSVALQCGMK